jgi:hypothetical protein
VSLVRDGLLQIPTRELLIQLKYVHRINVCVGSAIDSGVEGASGSTAHSKALHLLTDLFGITAAEPSTALLAEFGRLSNRKHCTCRQSDKASFDNSAPVDQSQNREKTRHCKTNTCPSEIHRDDSDKYTNGLSISAYSAIADTREPATNDRGFPPPPPPRTRPRGPGQKPKHPPPPPDPLKRSGTLNPQTPQGVVGPRVPPATPHPAHADRPNLRRQPPGIRTTTLILTALRISMPILTKVLG